MPVTHVTSPEQDLANRLPVWTALSEIYLDTELSPDQLELLAKTLAASPYSRDELEHILLAELHPVLAMNLLAVAGVWAGFDAGWLQARILARSGARFRWPTRLFPLRKSIRTSVRPVLVRVDELRQS